jgi:hypothetical protein
MSFNINPLIINSLKQAGVPYAKGLYRGDAETYINFTVYNEMGEDFADDVEHSTMFYLSVSVFAKGSPIEAAAKARKALEDAGFDHVNSEEETEEDTLLNAKKMRFIFYYEIMEVS